MTSTYPLLRSLDPHHARIGYLGALALVATRGLDRPDALLARYQDLLFERIYPEDPMFDALMDRVDSDRQAELLKRRRRPENEDPSARFTEAAPITTETPPKDWLLTTQPKRPQARLVDTEWLYVSEFWLFDRVMPSPLGALSREKAHRTLDLARMTQVLLPTLELSETGYLLQHLLISAKDKDCGTKSASFNPLNPAAHPALPILYFRVLLENEMLLPFLVLELVESEPGTLATRGSNGLLLRSVDRMLTEIGEVNDPEDALDIRQLDEFRSVVQKKEKTQENYLRPRLEILVDLGLVGRRGIEEGRRPDFVWESTPQTRALAEVVRPLATRNNNIPKFMDAALFGSWANVFGCPVQKVSSDIDRLLWFARAFEKIGREFGFTPARTLAVKACLLAWDAGVVMEVGEVLHCVYRAARGEWERFLRFSGGSRFDSEFLIRVDEGLLPELSRVIAMDPREQGGAS